ncbi:MAG: trypsin-like peptidase domain-containing protein [Candidatus Harrisonbacteria bacterium]|nr:trypsin-like peptidase domain-containing protein [Candidatus Harrisonbacteria bacterium]
MMGSLFKLTVSFIIASTLAIVGLYFRNNTFRPAEFSTSTAPVTEVGTTTAEALIAIPVSVSTTTIPHNQAATATKPLSKPLLTKIILPTDSKPALPLVRVSTATPAPLIVPESLSEKSIDVRSIVLTRCSFQTQYFKDSRQPWGEQEYNVGTGVIITPDGHILTARHILEVRAEILNDPAGRIWTLQGCDAAQTDKDRTPISSIGFWGQQSDSRFKPVKIIFKPTDEDYRDSAGFDYAILKIEGASGLPAFKLLPKPVVLKGGDLITIIGYPGRESASPQKLERFDSQFVEITYYRESVCDGSIKPCGLRYSIKRNPYYYEPDFWKDTELGVITPYFRGGFSGGPAFYKGNLIGIVTHGASGDKTESKWDEAYILTSYDIFENIKSLLDL